MMLNYEKRFPEDFELQAQFLELVNYVYRWEIYDKYCLLTHETSDSRLGN